MKKVKVWGYEDIVKKFCKDALF